MKFQWGYFDFTRAERIAFFSLIALLILLYFLPQLFSRLLPTPKTDYASFKKEIEALLNLPEDSTHKKIFYSKYSAEENYALQNSQIDYFIFNPNTISVNEWEKLGVKKHIAENIRKYLATGATFKRVDDLKKIYGITEDDFDRLEPYIQIPSNDSLKSFQTKASSVFYSTRSSPVELNTADSVLLESLNGIGPYLAHSIIHYRNALGGYYSVTQLAEVKGMKPENFEKLKSKFTVDVSLIKKININSISELELSRSPFLNYAQAKAIIAFKKAHGNFSSAEQLSQIEIIEVTTIQKLKPYLIFQ